LSNNSLENFEAKKAIALFTESFGSEAVVDLVSIEGRVLQLKFSGRMCQACGTSEYFNDFTLILEEVSDVPYAVWNYDWFSGPQPHFMVRIVRLDFLDELKEAMKMVGDTVNQRIFEFKEIGENEDSLFKELCFCILTANYKAEGGIRIQEALGNSFCVLEEDELAKSLRGLGHRFPSTRAKYIIESRRLYRKLGEILKDFTNGVEAREWLVKNVKGFGYKEASHFLRNIGFKDVAIIDRHILRFLKDKELIEELPKSLNRTRYIRLEKLLSAISEKINLNLGELDLYIWYTKTGKVLK
jgi:N-glycosylase/DNA lyase